jgi:hypothetical protein
LAKTAPKAAKGSGLKRKVLGLPVYVWAGALAGGLILGIYLRRKSAGSAQSQPDMASQDTSSLGAGATPSDNGVGSSTADTQAFLDAQGQLLQDFGTQLQGLLSGVQTGLNDGEGLTTPGPDMPVEPTPGVDLTQGLTPATLKAAWADYYAAQKKQGITTQTHAIPYSRPGTTVKVAGGAFTQVSRAPAAAVRKVRAIFVPAHKGERAHWALPSGRWVAGPGLY